MFKSVGSTWILNGLQIASVLLLAPFVIARLGDGPNGLWVTIVSFTGILSLLVLGVPLASVRFVAAALEQDDRRAKDAAVSTCLAICLALGAAALGIGALLGWAFDAHYLSGELGRGLSAGELDGARLAFAVVVVQVGLGFALRLPYGILDAHGDFVARNAVMAGEIVFRVAATFAALTWSPTLPALALVLAVSSVAEFAAALLVLKRLHPDVRFSLAAFDRALVREVLSFSVWALLLNVGALLSFRVAALVVGAFLPAEAATQFDVGNKFFEPLTSLVVAVSAVILPHATRLHARGAAHELRADFLAWSKICLSIVLPVCLYLVVCGPAFLGAWVGERFVGPSGAVLRVLALSFLVWLPVRGVAIAVLFGLGRPRAAALAFLWMGGVNLVTSVILAEPLGILGVALGTAIPNVVFAAWVLRLACREVGVPITEWVAHVAARALAGASAPLAFLLAVEWIWAPRGMPALLATGAGMLLVYAATWALYVYRDDPRFDARALLARLRPGGAR